MEETLKTILSTIYPELKQKSGELLVEEIMFRTIPYKESKTLDDFCQKHKHIKGLYGYKKFVKLTELDLPIFDKLDLELLKKRYTQEEIATRVKFVTKISKHTEIKKEAIEEVAILMVFMEEEKVKEIVEFYQKKYIEKLKQENMEELISLGLQNEELNKKWKKTRIRCVVN
jgi:hypothetical protein